jgi:transposase
MTIRVRAVGEEEREELARMARSRTVGAGLVRRARIVMHALEGLKAPEIGARMDLGGTTVRHWLKRFNARGLQGLEEDVRTGRPPTYSAEQRSAVIDTALTPPADLGLPFASWTLDRLVAHLAARGHRHAPQPDERDLRPRRPQVAARGDLVRRAGRPGLRP